MRSVTSLIVIAGALAVAGPAAAQMPARQDPALLRQVVEQYLQTQSVGLPGTVSIKVGQVDARLSLPACAALEPFLTPGSRVWGKTTVGVRCSVPSPWTVYVSATVQVSGEYFATAAPLAQGQTITKNDLVSQRGDLTALPAGIVTNPAQAIGRTLTVSLPAGMPLRQDSLRAQQAVQQGQLIRVVSGGAGFQVSTEGRALGNGADGQVVQARTASGQVVSGVARAGGIIEIVN